MATLKQTKANQQNSQKSCGPKSPEGKASSSKNACKHGVLSNRLLLDDESPEEYQQLLDGLQASLSPVGSLELMLVEKIAVCYWRQQRLIRAETAGIEFNRYLDTKCNHSEIEIAMGMVHHSNLDDHDLIILSANDEYFYDDACEIMAEYHVYIEQNVEVVCEEYLAKFTPSFYEKLEQEAENYNSISDFLNSSDGGIIKWLEKIYDQYCSIYVDVKRRRLIAKLSSLVKSLHSVPANHELIGKYQTTLDNELYRDIRALHEAQEWRLQSTGSPA